MATTLTDLTVSELARVLFASAVRPSDASTPERIRAAGAFRNRLVAA